MPSSSSTRSTDAALFTLSLTPDDDKDFLSCVGRTHTVMMLSSLRYRIHHKRRFRTILNARFCLQLIESTDPWPKLADPGATVGGCLQKPRPRWATWSANARKPAASQIIDVRTHLRVAPRAFARR